MDLHVSNSLLRLKQPMSLRASCRKNVTDNSANPRKAGSLDKNVETGLAGATAFEDVLKLQIKNR